MIDLVKKHKIAAIVIVCLFLAAYGSTLNKGEDADTEAQQAQMETEAESEAAESQLTTDTAEDGSQTSSNSTYMLDLSQATPGTAVDTGDLSLRFGDLLSVIYGGDGTVVVKAKIEPSMTNKLTISQNYHSVYDLVAEHGFNSSNGCNELQYWAVSDMRDGSESKAISFTVGKQLMNRICDGTVYQSELGEYVSDLWILPSLKD